MNASHSQQCSRFSQHLNQRIMQLDKSFASEHVMHVSFGYSKLTIYRPIPRAGLFCANNQIMSKPVQYYHFHGVSQFLQYWLMIQLIRFLCVCVLNICVYAHGGSSHIHWLRVFTQLKMFLVFFCCLHLFSQSKSRFHKLWPFDFRTLIWEADLDFLCF